MAWRSGSVTRLRSRLCAERQPSGVAPHALELPSEHREQPKAGAIDVAHGQIDHGHALHLHAPTINTKNRRAPRNPSVTRSTSASGTRAPGRQ